MLIVSDRNVFQRGLRAELQFPASSSKPSDPHTGSAIEFGYTRGSGSSSQSLASNYAYFGGKQFFAPTTLTTDFTSTYVDMAYRFRAIDRESGLGIEILAGIAFADLEMRVSSASQSGSETLTSPGVQIGLGLLWRVRPGTSVHLRGTSFRSADDNEVSRATRYEASLVQALGSNAAL